MSGNWPLVITGTFVELVHVLYLTFVFTQKTQIPKFLLLDQVDVVKGFKDTEKLIDELIYLKIEKCELTTVDVKIGATGI